MSSKGNVIARKFPFGQGWVKMLSIKKYVWIFGVLFIAMPLSIAILYPIVKDRDLREKQRVELASRLGVRIEDYPYPADFPVGYFYSVLKPGMTYDKVHSIVCGYESAYRCYGTDEIYYYFSKNEDENLMRFALYYDEQGQFVELQGEDPDSRTLGLGPGCSLGLLGAQ